MIIIKRIIFALIFLTLSNCGYETIYSKNNQAKISISEIELLGNKKINRKIINLTNLKNTDNKSYTYNLKINSTKKIEPITKDKKGDVSIYRMVINVEFYLSDPNDENRIVKKKNFRKSFTYNNLKKKFDLLEYEKNIENNLINRISEQIIIFLNS